MGDLFCHAATFARIADRLKPFADTLAPLTIDDSGTLARPWGASVPERPDLAIVYGTQDAYFSPAAGAFFRVLMAAPSMGWHQSAAAGVEHPVPHISARTEASKHRSDALFLSNLEAHLAGRPMRNLVPASEFQEAG